MTKTSYITGALVFMCFVVAYFLVFARPLPPRYGPSNATPPWKARIAEGCPTWLGSKDDFRDDLFNIAPYEEVWGTKRALQLAGMMTSDVVGAYSQAGALVSYRLECGGPVTREAFVILKSAFLDQLESKDWAVRNTAVGNVYRAGLMIDPDINRAVKDLVKEGQNEQVLTSATQVLEYSRAEKYMTYWTQISKERGY